MAPLAALRVTTLLHPRLRREQKLLHILQQELLRLRVAKVQAVMVDELLLGLGPFRPAHPADLFEGPAAELGRERLKCHSFSRLAASPALESRHRGKIDVSGNVIQSTGRRGRNG